MKRKMTINLATKTKTRLQITMMVVMIKTPTTTMEGKLIKETQTQTIQILETALIKQKLILMIKSTPDLSKQPNLQAAMRRKNLKTSGLSFSSPGPSCLPFWSLH